MTSSLMGRLRWRWVLAAVFGLGGLWTGMASAQQPTRLTVQQGGEPGVYVVNGVQPDKLPAVETRAAATPPVGSGTAATPFGSPTAAGCITPSTPCSSGHCGRVSCCGPKAFDGVTFCEAWAFHKNCCKTPATVPPPLGANVRTANDFMRSNALGEYFVIYREDWLNGTVNLNNSGERHFDGIVKRLGMTGAPVKVEPTGNAELDALRRVAVVEALTRNGLPPQEAQDRVLIGGTRAEGLRDNSIEALYYRGSTIYSMGGFGSYTNFGSSGGIYFPAYAGAGR